MQKAVLITGASTGIGRHLAHHLAERDHLVYAAVRKEADLAALSSIKNIIPIKLDVTNLEQIETAVTFITRQGAGLYGLVNNAGLGGLGYFTTWSEAEFQQIFDVNVAGPWRMSNAFLDLLLAAQGRIVNIGSQGGTVSKKLYGPYTMTKHALEAYTVALNEELRPFHVHVSIVQPGGIVSNIGANGMPDMVARLRRARPPFADEAQQILASFDNPPAPPDPEAPESETNRKPSSPEIVATAVYHALFADKPKLRYMVGTQWEGDRVINMLIQRLLDANDSPVHNYSRAELVALLDQHLQARNEAAAPSG
ncbi:MAG: SDR family NAD(P)-dependent oxidoreductase [Anaerolineaceae bacterium]|nr:SDR family NAD(P)-dependent oxidoreductase [Anaerolineaceae bacterium]